MRFIWFHCFYEFLSNKFFIWIVKYEQLSKSTVEFSRHPVPTFSLGQSTRTSSKHLQDCRLVPSEWTAIWTIQWFTDLLYAVINAEASSNLNYHHEVGPGCYSLRRMTKCNEVNHSCMKEQGISKEQSIWSDLNLLWIFWYSKTIRAHGPFTVNCGTFPQLGSCFALSGLRQNQTPCPEQEATHQVPTSRWAV